MTSCFLIMPNNIFEKKYASKILLLNTKIDIILCEDPVFFGDRDIKMNFNKKKLVLHRGSMKFYFDYLKENTNHNIKYLEYNFLKKDKYNFLSNYKKIYHYDFVDHLLHTKVYKIINKFNLETNELFNPLFLLSKDDIKKYKETKKGKNYFHRDFYFWQVEHLKIPFITKSYDSDNRKSIPKDIEIPNEFYFKTNDTNTDYVKEAKEYVEKNFKKNYGNLDNFIFPVTFKTSKKWVSYFHKHKFHYFGTYQDAIVEDKPFLFHSLYSSLMNIGLLTAKYIVDKSVDYYKNHKKEVEINNFEGFIRQIIGWREYQRMLYFCEYENLKNSNYFGLKKKLSKSWYNGSTGIKPVDDTIIMAFNDGYLHHIQRLMVIMNTQILCRINPHDIYKWFMEFACDSYDWVMIGNIYGMGYFSRITTRKPYISTSNYIRQMSNYKNDGIWNEIWDSLFYNFLVDMENKNKLTGGAAIYLRNLATFNKKSKRDKDTILKKAKYLL